MCRKNTKVICKVLSIASVVVVLMLALMGFIKTMTDGVDIHGNPEITETK